MAALRQRRVRDPAVLLRTASILRSDGVQGADRSMTACKEVRTGHYEEKARIPPTAGENRDVQHVSTRSGTALYVGAVLGPGVLLVPSLAAEAAGPASVLAWGALLAVAPLAAVFAALGVAFPEAGGTAAYARAAFGRPAAAVTGWWFLAGVLLGAPAVALIGGFYVADLLDAGRGRDRGRGGDDRDGARDQRRRAAIQRAAAAPARGRPRDAPAGRGRHGAAAGEAEHWRPFAPHGWIGVGTAASLLMFSFIGWEAGLAPGRRVPRSGAPAPPRPARCAGDRGGALPRPRGRDRRRPRHRRAVRRAARRPMGGPRRAGSHGTAALAVLLTMGTMNAYVAAP